MMTSRRLRVSPLRHLVVVFLALGVLAFTATPALAVPKHGLVGVFGSPSSSPSNPEPLSGPTDVAVDEATGDIYVADTGNHRVEYFTGAGAYLGQFNGGGTLSTPEGISIDNDSASPSHDDVYVVNAGADVIEKFSAIGELKGELQETEGAAGGFVGVAVDPNGNVWALANNGQAIEFNAEGAYVSGSSFRTEKEEGHGLAVDATGNLYVVTHYRRLKRISPSEEGQIGGEAVAGAAVDQSTTSVYVDEESVISKYGPLVEPFENEPKSVESFGTDGVSGGDGLAVDDDTGTVYVVNGASNDVAIYALLETPEAPRTSAATSISATSATLHGELNPGGTSGALEYQFEYNAGNSCAGGQATPTPAATAAEAKNAAVVIVATGLQPNTTYTDCLNAINAGVSERSTEESTFTTLSAAPSIADESVSTVTPFEAIILAEVDPNNELTRWRVEYSTSPSLSAAISLPSPEGTIAAGPASAEIGEELSALAPDTVYYYRVVASNSGGGMTVGPVESFATRRPAVPGVTTEIPMSIGTESATVAGEVDPQGADTKYGVEFGTTDVLGADTVPVDAGSAITGLYVTVALEGLLPDTTYSYRFVATNSGGEGRGTIRSFTTNAAGEPGTVVAGGFSLTGTSSSPSPVTPFPLLAGIAPAPVLVAKGSTTPTVRPLSGRQRLQKALRACRERRSAPPQRHRCEREAHKKYAPRRGQEKKS
jgi:DNA-binding beta-propeller fold protein YncE